MSDTIITVEKLGKRYSLRHQRTEHYATLRDVLTNKARNLFRRRANGQIDPTREDFWALRDVSFEVKRGEVIGVIGRNGAGKSTLLKILSRITEPTTGRVHLKGRVASLLEVGTGFHPELTGRENIFLNGAILGMSRIEIKAKFDEIVAFAEVERFLDTPVKRYSSGMYVRLAFAVAAHLEPEILVIDEVLAVGDTEFQKKCLGKMRDVASGGRTVLFVSHNMPTIQSFCQRVLLLELGRLAAEGPPAKAISHYVNQGDRGDITADLRDHRGRRHSTQSALMAAWVEDSSHALATTLSMAEPVYFCFAFRCQSAVVSPVFGFGIEDDQGRRVFSLNNLMKKTAASAPRTISQGVARLFVPRNPLMPGRYHLSVSIVEAPGTWVDFVEHAKTFEVVASDVYGSGRVPEPEQGSVFVDGEILVEDGLESSPAPVSAVAK